MREKYIHKIATCNSSDVRKRLKCSHCCCLRPMMRNTNSVSIRRNLNFRKFEFYFNFSRLDGGWLTEFKINTLHWITHETRAECVCVCAHRQQLSEFRFVINLFGKCFCFVQIVPCPNCRWMFSHLTSASAHFANNFSSVFHIISFRLSVWYSVFGSELCVH